MAKKKMPKKKAAAKTPAKKKAQAPKRATKTAKASKPAPKVKNKAKVKTKAKPKAKRAQMKKAAGPKAKPAPAAKRKGKHSAPKALLKPKAAPKPKASAKPKAGPVDKMRSGPTPSARRVMREPKIATGPIAKPAPRPVAPAVPLAPNKRRPAKERYQLEILVHSAPTVLYELLSTPSGFSEWFCDDVDVRDEVYTFQWDGEQQRAQVIGRKQGEVIRFHWMDDEDPESFFEFRIRIDPMTDEVALIVTDHAWPKDVDNAKALWESQVANLMRVLGA
jgi:uncharacterized protein YndB with AHSA1/START domain